jgi:type I restriction enzyme M protein
VTTEAIQRLTETKQWAKLTEAEQADVSDRLTSLVGSSTTEKPALAQKLGALPKAIEKQLWDALAVADPAAPVVTNRKGIPEPDPDLRDNENVPLPAVPVTWEADVTERLASLEYRSAVEEYVAAEVLPYVADAWVDYDKTKIGYEIPLTRHFYTYVPPRALVEIDAEIKQLESEIQGLLIEVTE